MNNLKQVSRKIGSCMAASVCAIVLFLTACQKDETTQPSATANGDRLTNPPSTVVYQMLKIDHQAGYGVTPVYEVIVNSDGTAMFIGHRNVGTIGQKTFRINEATFRFLQNMFLSSHFFSIIDKVTYIPDAAPIYTTFNDGTQSKTLMDYDNGYPQMLIQLRQQTEEELNIKEFILAGTADVAPNL